MLLCGQRITGAAFDRRIVGDDDAFSIGDASAAGNDAGGRNGIVVDMVAGKLREFEKGRIGIEQQRKKWSSLALCMSRIKFPQPGL